jgi:hypothetical protein
LVDRFYFKLSESIFRGTVTHRNGKWIWYPNLRIFDIRMLSFNYFLLMLLMILIRTGLTLNWPIILNGLLFLIPLSYFYLIIRLWISELVIILDILLLLIITAVRWVEVYILWMGLQVVRVGGLRCILLGAICVLNIELRISLFPFSWFIF